MDIAAFRIAALALSLVSAVGQSEAQQPISASQAIGDVTLHYLDFGGEGLPIVFIHAASRGAGTWMDFAPRFTERHRVLALTARGVGESTGEPGPTEVRAADILALMDSLAITRAVFIGNSSPARDMTHLAEHHPDRVAGLVYLANAPLVAGLTDSDPTGAFDYALRATQPPDPYPYRPVYLRAPGHRLTVPALTFVGRSGTRGLEREVYPLIAADMVASEGGSGIRDAEARAFMERLGNDEELQAEVAEAWRDHVAPAIVRNERAFRDAFGSHLRVVQLPLSAVSGYEYLNQPEMILPHVRTFLEGLASGSPVAPAVDIFRRSRGVRR